MAEKKGIDAVSMYAVKKKHVLLKSIVSSAIPSVAGYVLDKGLVSGQIQKTAIRAVVHFSMINAPPMLCCKVIIL